MATYPGVVAISAFKEFLAKLENVGVPGKVDTAFLAQLGYKSSNHRSFPTAMKFVGLLNPDNSPNDLYKRGIRGGQAGRAVVAEGIKKGYSDLFEVYPDAQAQPIKTLTDFFRAKTNLGDRSLQAVVGTFQALCSFADFTDGAAPVATAATLPPLPSTASRVAVPMPASFSSSAGVIINVNIELSIDATSDASVYENFFAAMAKHILVLRDGESHSDAS